MTNEIKYARMREENEALRRVIVALLFLVAILIGCAAGAWVAVLRASAQEPTYEPVSEVCEESVSLPTENENPVVELLEPTVETETMTVRATAYCPCVKCCGVWSAEHTSRRGTDYVQKTTSGTVPEEGRTIAVDPTVIELGTTVIIGGCEFVAEDTGGAIKGKKIDIFFDDHEEALDWGVRDIEIEIVKD